MKNRTSKDNTIARTANTKLKYVNRLLFIISGTVFDGGSTSSLDQPFSKYSLTWSLFKPYLISALNLLVWTFFLAIVFLLMFYSS